MDKLIIFGAGQQGRNCLNLARRLGIEVVAFVDDYVFGMVDGVLVYRDLRDVEKYKQCKAIVAVGDLGVRQQWIDVIEQEGIEPLTLIDPSAQIEEGAKIGKGNYIYKLVSVYASSKIGDHNIINTGAVLATDCVIGDNCNICFGSNICGAVEVGDNSIIGYNASVASGFKVGHDAIVEANSVVYRNVADFEHVGGVVK